MPDVPGAENFSNVLDGSWLDLLDQEREVAPLPEQIGPYRLGRILGQGGTGEVHEAERTDGKFERKVAIKLLYPGYTLSREARILAQLNHPGIARLLDAGQLENGREYLVLEYIEGEQLAAMAPVSVEQTVEWMTRLLEILDYAHRRGVLHRDIKPNNAIIDPQGILYLIDFSAATQCLPGNTEACTLHRGWTPRYASPEQWAGEAGTVKSDVYSLGVMLGELLAEATDPWHAARQRLQRVAGKASSLDPQDRYKGCMEFLEDLQAAHLGGPMLASQSGNAWMRSWASLRRRAWVPALLLLGFAAAGTLGTYATSEAQQRYREEVKQLSNIGQPTMVRYWNDDQYGENRKALLALIHSWEQMELKWGPRREVLEALFSLNSTYAHLLHRIGEGKAEEKPESLAYYERALALADRQSSLDPQDCRFRHRRVLMRISLANLLIDASKIEEARAALAEAAPQVGELNQGLCRDAVPGIETELKAVASRILFARQRWEELIRVRTEILESRRQLVTKADSQRAGDRELAQINLHHSETALGWAYFHAGQAAVGYAHYARALRGLEGMLEEHPTNVPLLMRLEKFHREAGEIAHAQGKKDLCFGHRIASKRYRKMLENL
ncbi:MAG: hypothetical protein OHK0021_09330 [Bryobacter sp.]